MFIVRLSRDILYSKKGVGWRVSARMNSIRWYSLTGETLGTIENISASVNFLNPDHETLLELWKPYGTLKTSDYMGKEGTSSRVYSRYAVIAWPAAQHTENAVKFMPEDIAVGVLYPPHKSVDASGLRTFLKDLDQRLANQLSFSWHSHRDIVSVAFCRAVCKLLIDARDPDLVNFFFAKLCPELDGLEGNESLVQPIIAIVRKFDWDVIGKVFLNILGDYRRFPTGEAPGARIVEMTLKVIDGLDNGPARRTLLKLAVKLAPILSKDEFCCGEHVEIMWKHAIQSEDKGTFDAVTNMFKETDAFLLRRSVNTISTSLNEIDGRNKRYPVLACVVSKRVQWLKNQVEALNRPFSWEMTEAEFPDNLKVQQFLQGPDVTMRMTKSVHKIKGHQNAINCAAKWQRENQDNASFEVEVSSLNGNVVVTITKTPQWFMKRQQKLQRFKTELRGLMKHNCDNLSDGTDRFGARLGKETPRHH